MRSNKRVEDGGRLPASEPSEAVRELRLDMGGRAGIVTGAARGIGRAIAEGLSAAGAETVLVDRESALEQTARELGSEAFVADLAEDGTPDAVFERASELVGRVDFLVNAARVQARGPVVELDDESWERLYAVN